VACIADVIRAADAGICGIVPAEGAEHLVCHSGWGCFGVVPTRYGRERLAAVAA
jgi:hypothetical protein